MADIFADNLVKKSIRELIENKGKIPVDETIWINLTKGMLLKYEVKEVLNFFERAVEEVSDEHWFKKKYPPSIFQDYEEKIIRKKTNNKLRDLINKKLNIIDVAKSYGLDTDKKGNTTCPFHNDSDPSLKLSSAKNIFHCFGCHAKGDIIKFIQMLEDRGYEKK